MTRNLTTGLQRGLRQSIAGGLGAGDIFSTASLDLNFARHKSLDSRITFSRASSGTYVDAAGVIRTAGNNVARFDHNPTTGESLGLLVEESRTNFIETSEPATGNNLAGTTNSLVSDITTPDGQVSTVREITFGSNTAYRFGSTTAGTSGTTYTGSIWIRTVSGTGSVTLDVNDIGVLSCNLTETWQRFGVTGTRTDGNNYRFLDITGNGFSVYVWGVQLEAGSFPTSYIRTTGSTATRSADVASITGTNFSSWYNQTEGTVFASIVGLPIASGQFPRIYEITDGTLNNVIRSQSYGSNTVRNNIVSGGTVNMARDGGTIAEGSKGKTAFALAANNCVIVTNAGIPAIDDTVTLPNNLDQILILSSTSGTSAANSTISRLTYWPTRLSNDTLQTITR